MRHIEGESRPTLANRIKEIPNKIGRLILPSQRQLAAEAAGSVGNINTEDPKTANRFNLKAKGRKAPATPIREAETADTPSKDPLTKFLDDKAIFDETNAVAIVDAPTRIITRLTDLPTTEIGSIPKKGIRGVTQEEARELNRKRIEGKPKKGLSTGQKVGVVGVTTLAAIGLPQVVPAVRHAEADFLRNIRGDNLQVDNVFNPTATEGIIKPIMIERLPQAEIDRLYPTAFEKLAKEKVITSVPPKPGEKELSVEVGNGQTNTLQMEYPIDLSQSTKPNAEIQFTKSFSGGPQVVREAFQGKGYYDTIEFPDVPGGTKILAPVDGFLVASIDDSTPARPSNGTADTSTVLIDFTDQNGYQYRIMIAGGTDLGGDPRVAKTGFVFKSLINTPLFSQEDNQKLIGTYGIQIKKGQPILEVIQPSNGNPVEVALRINSALKSTNGERATILNSPIALTNVEFFTDPAGKLLLPQR